MANDFVALSALGDIELYKPAVTAVIENLRKRRLGAFGVGTAMNSYRNALPSLTHGDGKSHGHHSRGSNL